MTGNRDGVCSNRNQTLLPLSLIIQAVFDGSPTFKIEHFSLETICTFFLAFFLTFVVAFSRGRPNVLSTASLRRCNYSCIQTNPNVFSNFFQILCSTLWRDARFIKTFFFCHISKSYLISGEPMGSFGDLRHISIGTQSSCS